MRPNGPDQNNRLGNEMQLILKFWGNWCIINQLSCVLLMYFFQQDIIVKLLLTHHCFEYYNSGAAIFGGDMI